MDILVSDLLHEKGNFILSTSPDTSVIDTIGKMVDANVGSILIMRAGNVVGIFTERDYLRRVALEGRSAEDTRVEDVMTEGVITVEPDATVDSCLSIMTKNKCRHLPVEEDGELVGIVSIGDCVKHLSRRAQQRARSLTRYITGGYSQE